MGNYYVRFLPIHKTGLTLTLVAGIAWFAANSFAEEAIKTEKIRPPVEELQIEPKLLSEMKSVEKARLSKKELLKLKELEEKMKKLEKPKY
ncbi:MAG: hypothetical protein ACI9FR_001939 [Cryomorphaceae bacterium]|jgi:hypothetical protein